MPNALVLVHIESLAMTVTGSSTLHFLRNYKPVAITANATFFRLGKPLIIKDT